MAKRRRKRRARLRKRAESASSRPALRSVHRRPRAARRGVPSITGGERLPLAVTEIDNVIDIDGVRAKIDLHFDAQRVPTQMSIVFLVTLVGAFRAALGEEATDAFPLHVVVSGWNGADLCGTIEPE